MAPQKTKNSQSESVKYSFLLDSFDSIFGTGRCESAARGKEWRNESFIPFQEQYTTPRRYRKVRSYFIVTGKISSGIIATASHSLPTPWIRQPLESFLDSFNRVQCKIGGDGKNNITRTGIEFVMQAKIFSNNTLYSISVYSTTDASIYTYS